MARVIFVLSFVLVSAAAADSDVEGNVVGQWLREDGPFHVLSDIQIPADEELTIDAGVQVLFEGGFHFTVRGRLNAIGGDLRDQHIIFTRPDSTRWWGINFTSESHIRSRLLYCELINPWIGVECDSCSPRINNTYIQTVNKGIELDAAAPDIDGNMISFGAANSHLNPVGISMINRSAPRIRNNRVELNAGSGSEIIGIMIDDSQPIIENNWIDLKSEGTAYGVFSSGHVTKLWISYNIIRTHSPTEMVGLRLCNSTGVRVYNNDIHLIGTSSAGTGMYFDSGCSILLYNNIIFGNGSSTGIIAEDDVIDVESGYNDLWAHSLNYSGLWRGANTDIYADPRWVNAHSAATAREDYALQWINYPRLEGKSPCIDAGMPGPLDLDGTRQDIGAVYYHQVPIVDVADGSESLPLVFTVNTHPNPFNSQLTIDVNLGAQDQVSIAVFDFSGRAVQQIWNGPLGGAQRLSWHPSAVPAGEYLLRVQSRRGSQVEKIVFLP